MRRGLIVVLMLVACVPSEPRAVEPGIVEVQRRPSALSEPPAESLSTRFPAGPGVTLMADDPRLNDWGVGDARPFAERVEGFERTLGVKTIPIEEPSIHGRGALAHVLAASSPAGPYSCQEAIVAEQVPHFLLRRAEATRCGLPFASEAGWARGGPSTPRLTVTKLREVVEELRRPKDPHELAWKPDAIVEWRGYLEGKLGQPAPDTECIAVPTGCPDLGEDCFFARWARLPRASVMPVPSRDGPCHGPKHEVTRGSPTIIRCQDWD